MIASIAWALLAFAQQTATSPAARAEAVVHLLSTGRFDAIEAQFDDTMKTALPPGRLATTWSALTSQVGGFQKETGTREETVGAY